MKKRFIGFMLILGMLLFPVVSEAVVYTRVRPDEVTGEVITADGAVKTEGGTVYYLHISWDGVTAGDIIEIKNSADDSGTALITLEATGTDHNDRFCPSVGVEFSTGIYYDETLNSGDATVTIVYE